ncbi:MAG: type III-A CRISPR-associated protein Csm2 [Phycisphaerales bacterium]
MSSYSGRPTGGSVATAVKPLFDPKLPDAALFDTLAERQADAMEKIVSSQLRRFFGEVKELYRRFDALTRDKDASDAEAIYRQHIEPLFKMIRSKVAYASRQKAAGTVPVDFQRFIDHGVSQVSNPADFRRFVMHFEAVVGFLYGKGKVER